MGKNHASQYANFGSLPKVVHIFITSKDKKTFFSVKGAVMGNFAKCSSQIAISREAISPYLCNIENK